MKWISGILLNAVLFLFLAWLLPGFHVNGFGAAILASFILALVNMIIRPIFVLFTLPITLISLGLFLFVINAIMLLLTTKIAGNGFVIEGFVSALLIAFLLSIFNLFFKPTTKKSKK